jgi:hypothetical protein
MYWLYYEMKKYDNYTDAERIQLWALGTFYYDTLGHQWHNKENWMTDKKGVTVCDWYGLTCDADGMVVEMNLADNRVRRDLPYEFTLLSKLRYLRLSENSLRTLPTLLFEMPELDVIDFDANGIKEIPHIPKRNRVRELYLAQNRIYEIPSSIGELQKLEVLWLWKNDLSGTLPSDIGRLANLGK